jgi:hypothetical protein
LQLRGVIEGITGLAGRWFVRQWIASLALAMTVRAEFHQSFRNTIEAIHPVISAMNAVTSP